MLLQQEGFDCINRFFVPLCGLLSEDSLLRRAKNLQWSERTRSSISNKLVEQQYSVSLPPPPISQNQTTCVIGVLWFGPKTSWGRKSYLYHRYTISSCPKRPSSLLLSPDRCACLLPLPEIKADQEFQSYIQDKKTNCSFLSTTASVPKRDPLTPLHPAGCF